ncbi:heavy metal translocating P-type ATPase [Haloferula sp.]|uniref:heavy metal translocating P-type ATPase n=1 Tax=Haloferula sp. TaxID=2497595 RepID=UPI003C707B55
MHQQTQDVKKSDCGCEHDHASGLPQKTLIAAAGVLTGLGLVLKWTGVPELWQMIAFAIATLSGGALVFPAAWKALLKFKLDMNVLMTVAVIGAWIIGEHAEAAAVVFLFALSEWLEGLSAERARNAVRSLMALTPETALLKSPDGTVEEVAATGVSAGELILVRSGQRIPLDGKVISGRSAVNQAPITGESIPVEKDAGDEVYAGTVNGEGSLVVKVTKAAADSTLARITRMVVEAESSKAPTQRFVDKFAAIYTPLVFVAAILTALIAPLFLGGEWQPWIYKALALLVIACPCALVIATPVSIVSGLTALARRGVLVKGGTHLEALGKLKALAVDKTGTITAGKPRVVALKSLSEETEARVLALAASIDSHSEHPIARAVVEHAESRKVSIPKSINYQSIPGQGAEAEIDGVSYFVGNHRLVHASGLCGENLESKLGEVESKGLSLAVLARQPHGADPGEVLGLISIGDALRPDAQRALAALHEAGLKRIVMLSGDNQRTVDAIAEEAGLDEAFGDMMPEDKVTKLREMIDRHGQVGMIGDGVNDAPALAIASVGIAMGAIGSDTAIETADVALMKDDLGKLAEAINLGKRTLGMIRFNIGFALLVKAIFLVLTFSGHATLWMAILADTGATLLVIVNSLRLLGRPSEK